MENRSEANVCPVCGSSKLNREHSCMGTREDLEGQIQYWACFRAGDVFAVKAEVSED